MNDWYYKKVERENGKYYYLAVTVCEKCGSEFNSGNVAASKYCPECAKKIRAEQNRERVKRYREKQKLKQDQEQTL